MLFHKVFEFNGLSKKSGGFKSAWDAAILLYAFAQIVLLIYVWINHISFPLNLEAMELYSLLHVERILLGLPIYVKPSVEFIPFVYNPLYYYLTVPFTEIFGVNLQSLRLVSIIGSVGAIVVLHLSVKKMTRSAIWGYICAGLFAASYQAMDNYIDTAHADSWLLFMILLGCYLIDLQRSMSFTLLGVLALVLSFWFKQHGALFLIGAIIYLTLRDGLRRAWLHWVIGIIFGFGLYYFYPQSLLGSYFHYYTWQVPSQWSQLDIDSVRRIIGYTVKNYSLLAGVSVSALVYFGIKVREKMTVWMFMLPIAILSGVMGSLDPENNNNVFIPMATWYLIVGTMTLAMIIREGYLSQYAPLIVRIAIIISFGLLYYQPANVLVTREWPDEYQDLGIYLEKLDGPVYAPWFGESFLLGYKFYPSVHWVPLYDIVRGPDINVSTHPLPREILDSVYHPNGKAYILMSYPLENDILIGFLSEHYILDKDLGERFEALSTLPRRYSLGYPRFLYKYQP
jgi:4-amino-4-deoxy-L-arabinose transferase-like glycosyltransferase